MGKYDDIPPERLRADLVRFARLILRLEADGRLLHEVPGIQRLIGNLRQKLFAYEVRSTSRLEAAQPDKDTHPEDAGLGESLRIVRDAIERQERMRAEWDEAGPGPDRDDDA